MFTKTSKLFSRTKRTGKNSQPEISWPTSVTHTSGTLSPSLIAQLSITSTSSSACSSRDASPSRPHTAATNHSERSDRSAIERPYPSVSEALAESEERLWKEIEGERRTRRGSMIMGAQGRTIHCS